MPNQHIPEVVCPKCRGAGSIDLAEPLLRVLRFVRQHRQATAQDVFEMLGREVTHPTAANNRLEDLRKLQLLDRRRRGRNWVYFIP
jgi:hypothetical protein